MPPICLDCARFYRPKKNGFYFTEGKPGGGNDSWDGKSGKDSIGWTPYKVWAGDLYECPGCGHKIIAGFGYKPLVEDYEKDFEHVRTRVGANQLLVKDCP